MNLKSLDVAGWLASTSVNCTLHTKAKRSVRVSVSLVGGGGRGELVLCF